MKTCLLNPAIISPIWGGTKLFSYGKKSEHPTIGESWELSMIPEHPSLIASGENAGKPLYLVAKNEDIGTKAASFEIFPTLIKFIDSAQFLSVQVHPSDEYALRVEHQLGKTEMWYVLDAEEGAGLYLGFNRDTSPEEVRRRVADGSIEEILNFIPVHPGESYFIPSGTVHAIGAGVTVIEIQQNSTITYRLYDYKRKDANGNERELHIEKALDVLNYHKYEPTEFRLPLIGESSYFRSVLSEIKPMKLTASKASFKAISILDGSGFVDDIPYSKGRTFFLPAGQTCEIKGAGHMVITEVPE